MAGGGQADYTKTYKEAQLADSRVISIIDDDASVREAIESLIRSLGYPVAGFASAEEYLQSDRITDSACVISDLHMPGMNGADLQDRLLADGYRIPIIFVTAFFEEAVRDRVLEAGALGILRKPFAEETLINCLDRALNADQASQ
jgi:FixJ family two-component response regulator